MCGILGIVRPIHERPTVDDATVVRMRDTMTHRGPDGAGFWRAPNAVLAHRRLAVIDPTPQGQQPMTTADGRVAIVYNGELYNDDELRRELSELGVRFQTRCDTETVLHAIATWGPAAIVKLRGMFALGVHNLDQGTLLLARDPLGIKPLYWSRLPMPAGGDEIVFASEPRAILTHPAARTRPDLGTISSYLTTIRLTLDDRTLFDGVRTVRPGEWIEFDLRSEVMPTRRGSTWPVTTHATDVGTAVETSVRAHLRSDVPWCALLSGGLDSTIVAHVAAQAGVELHTYCSGHHSGSDQDDFAHARRAAAALRTRHTEAPVTRELFAARWPDMIGRQHLPLSTPNEVAINEVARTLRARGHVVTLSGEGADELFGGYGVALALALQFERDHPRATDAERATHQLAANAWVPPDAKPTLLRPEVWRAVEADAALHASYTAEFAWAGHIDDSPLDAALQRHLVFQRRVNLAGLLARLDTATMLESVEGRTPLADARVARLAEALPMSEKCAHASLEPNTKVALRRAFAGRIPADIVARPKASFPLPFQPWLEDHAEVLRTSAALRGWLEPALVDAVAERPGTVWSLAWPMVNLAYWARAVWG